MKKKIDMDIYIGIFIILVSLFFLWKTRGIKPGAALFPQMLLVGSILLSIGIIWGGIRKSKDNNATESSNKKFPFVVYICIIAYGLLFWLCGYFIASTLFLIVLMRYLQIKSWKKIIPMTLAYLMVIYLMFVWQFRVPIDNFGYIGNFIIK
jgi:hypothetical protein